MPIPFHTSKGTVDLAALKPEDIAAPVIAEALSKINRFSGHTRLPWSVAAHSLLVEHLCPSVALKGWALLHDAHEAFLGDITTPALEMICVSGSSVAVHNAINNAKGRLDRAIGAAWSCSPLSMNLEIRRADWIALQAERLYFFNEAPAPELTDQEHMTVRSSAALIEHLPKGSDWLWAARAWLQRAVTLATDGRLTLPGETTPSSISLVG